MKNRNVRFLALGIALLLAVSCLSGCGGASKEVNNLMTEFEHACNTLDIDAMLNCIDPTVADPVKVGLSLYGMFAQNDNDKTLDQIAGGLSGDPKLNGNEFFSSIKIEVKKTSVKGDNATVETNIQYKLLGQNYNRDASFTCIEKSGKWYIKGFRFV